MTSSRKCKQVTPPPPTPPGPTKQVSVYANGYGKYPAGNCGGNYGPGAFSYPGSSAGMCNSTYSTTANTTKHFTKIYVRYLGSSNNIGDYFWDTGISPFII